MQKTPLKDHKHFLYTVYKQQYLELIEQLEYQKVTPNPQILMLDSKVCVFCLSSFESGSLEKVSLGGSGFIFRVLVSFLYFDTWCRHLHC